MKEKLIKIFNLKFVTKTKWNEIYYPMPMCLYLILLQNVENQAMITGHERVKQA